MSFLPKMDCNLTGTPLARTSDRKLPLSRCLPELVLQDALVRSCVFPLRVGDDELVRTGVLLHPDPGRFLDLQSADVPEATRITERFYTLREGGESQRGRGRTI